MDAEKTVFLNPTNIVRAAAIVKGANPDLMTEPGRSMLEVKARRLAAHVMRTELGASLREIGIALGRSSNDAVNNLLAGYQDEIGIHHIDYADELAKIKEVVRDQENNPDDDQQK